MTNKTNSLVVQLKSSLNRAVVFTAFPAGKPVNMIVYHSKKSSALQFDVGSFVPIIKSGEVQISMYRNLDNCKFASTFFVLENLKVPNYDYQSKFGGIEKLYDNQLYPFTKEKYDLQAGNSNEQSTNYLLVLGWKVIDLEDDLLFYFVQRRCFNNITRTNVIRTAGLQFATARGLEALDQYQKNSEKQIKRVNKIPSFLCTDECEQSLDETCDG